MKNSKKGFVSIETIISLVPIMMVVFLSIGFFCYMYPQIAMEKQVHVLAETAKIQGGLTDNTSDSNNSDIDNFLKKAKKFGFDKNDIKITAITDPGDKNAIGVTPLNEDGDNYIKRNTKEVINISVTYPSNNFIVGPLRYFNISSYKLKYQTIHQSVLSERW